MKEKKVTIRMVSEQANVSKTTISRFLNGKFEYMSEETKEKIQKVIDELNYRPNRLAMGLKSKKSGLMGVIVADITNPFSSILVKGVNDACTENEYDVIIANSDDDPKKERDYIFSMIDRQVEGIIINTSGGNDELIAQLISEGIKIVVADRVINSNIVDTVTTNNEDVTREMTQIIYNEGFEKVAFFSKSIENNTTRSRRHNSFLEESKNYQDSPEELVHIMPENADDDLFVNELLKFIRQNKEYKKAILAVNGVMVLNMLNAINKLGLKIPEDIGICGFDDWGWAGVIGEGISVISQPSYEIGYKSAGLLIERLKSENKDIKPRYIELEATIKLRGSTRIKR